MSIMSLQQFAINITHAVRTTLNQIRDRVEFFYRYYPDPEEEDLFILYSKEMYERFKVLNRVINYMLSYSQSNLTPEEVDLKTRSRKYWVNTMMSSHVKEYPYRQIFPISWF